MSSLFIFDKENVGTQGQKHTRTPVNDQESIAILVRTGQPLVRITVTDIEFYCDGVLQCERVIGIDG